MDFEEVIYCIDEQDRLIFVNSEWDRFALANSGEAITANQIIDLPLWTYITDLTTQELYHRILKQVRKDGRTIRFNFRCDSPDRRRLLEMKLGRNSDGMVEFRTRTLSEEARSIPALLEQHTPHSDELLRSCGWCKKVFIEGSWVEVEEAAARIGLFERPLLPKLTHGICESCTRKMEDNLQDS